MSEDAPLGEWERVPWERRVDAACELAGREAWVTEGVYAEWTEPLVSVVGCGRLARHSRVARR